MNTISVYEEVLIPLANYLGWQVLLALVLKIISKGVEINICPIAVMATIISLEFCFSLHI